MSGVAYSIKKKMDSCGTPLSQWQLSINRGLLTGLNEAFIIDGPVKDRLIAEDPKSAEIIRPILRGRDIKRYQYSYADLWIIATFPSKNYDIDEYPAIKNHLLSFGIERLWQDGKTYIVNGETIKARKKTNNKWFETQDSIKYWDDFLKPKIVYREISDCMDACIIEPDVYLNNKCYLITGDHLIYLLSIFNSTLFNRVLLQGANTTGGKGFAFLEKIRIPYPTEAVEMELIGLYNKRKDASPAESEEIDYQVDNIVYRLYSLSTEEIRFINGN